MKVNIGKYPKKTGERKIKVQIDPHDLWSLDHTLSHIIHPALLAIKEEKGGIPYVDNNDVPEQLRTPNDGPEHGFSEKKWDYVLDEMIFAFEQIKNDYPLEETFWRTQPELDRTVYPEDVEALLKPVRWKVDGDLDKEGQAAYYERIHNGLILFGKYYRSLWT